MAFNYQHENSLMLFLSIFLFLFVFFLFPLLVIICLQKLHLLNASSAGVQSAPLRDHKLHSAPSRNQTGLMCSAGEAGSVDGKVTAVGSSLAQRRGSQRGQRRSSHSPAHSSDSTHSQQNHAQRGRTSRHQKRYSFHLPHHRLTLQLLCH